MVLTRKAVLLSVHFITSLCRRRVHDYWLSHHQLRLSVRPSVGVCLCRCVCTQTDGCSASTIWWCAYLRAYNVTLVYWHVTSRRQPDRACWQVTWPFYQLLNPIRRHTAFHCWPTAGLTTFVFAAVLERDLRPVYSDATQLDVELSCVAINGPLAIAGLSVCLSVTRWYWLKAKDREILLISPSDSPGSLSFLTATFTGNALCNSFKRDRGG